MPLRGGELRRLGLAGQQDRGRVREGQRIPVVHQRAARKLLQINADPSFRIMLANASPFPL